MLGLFGLGSSSEINKTLAKVIALQRDPRGWQEVVAQLLLLEPALLAKCCKDRRTAEVLLNLCESQLLPYPAVGAATVDLLRATALVLQTRVGSSAAKISIDFLYASARGIMKEVTSSESTLSLAEAAALIDGHLSIFLAIVDHSTADLPGTVLLAEDERAERANRSSFFSAGGLMVIFEVLAAGEARLGDRAIAHAVQVLYVLLTVRPDRTEYPVLLALLQCAGLHAGALLNLCRHPTKVVRRSVCEVLQAILLESEPAQYALWQHAALERGALPLLLIHCFAGGHDIMAGARPRLLFGDAVGGGDSAASSHRATQPASVQPPGDSTAASGSATSATAVAAVPSRAMEAEAVGESVQACSTDAPAETPSDATSTAGALPSASTSTALDAGPGRQVASLSEQTDQVCRPADDPYAAVTTGAAAAIGAIATTGVATRSGTAVPHALAADGATPLTVAEGVATTPPSSINHEAAEAERSLCRRLIALLCDDSDLALSLLARVCPRVFVQRHLYRPESPPPLESSAVMAMLQPAERVRVKALGRAERERYCRSLKHHPQLPRGSWQSFWHALCDDHYEADVVWDRTCLLTLQRACAQELLDFDAECRHAQIRGQPLVWEHRSFRVSYPQLRGQLYVAPYFITPLIRWLENADDADSPPLSQSTKPTAYVVKLWQQCVVEDMDASKAHLLTAMGLFYGRFGGTEPSLPCMSYLVWLLARAAQTACASAALVRAVLGVLSHAFKFSQNVRAFIEADGLQQLSLCLLRVPVQPRIVAGVIRACTPDAHSSEDGESAALQGQHGPGEAAAKANAASKGEHLSALSRVAEGAHVPELAASLSLLSAMPIPSDDVVAAACDVGVAVLDLLQTVTLSSHRVARELCSAPHLNRIAQVVLCGHNDVVGRCAELLSMLCDVVPELVPSLYRSGAFHFFLAAIPSDTGAMPIAAAHFFQRFHDRQGEPSIAASNDAEMACQNDSFLLPAFPPQLVILLNEGTPDEFVRAMASDAQLPHLFWGLAFRQRLEASVFAEIAPYCVALLHPRAAEESIAAVAARTFGADVPGDFGGRDYDCETGLAGAREHNEGHECPSSSNLPLPSADTSFSSRYLCSVHYPLLEQEFSVAGVILAFFNREPGAARLPQADRFADHLIAALARLQQGEGVHPPSVINDDATEQVPSAASRMSEDMKGEKRRATVMTDGEMQGGGPVLKRQALILEAQRLLLQSHPTLPHCHLYPRDGWAAILSALSRLPELVADCGGCVHPPSAAVSELLPLCEQAVHLLHFLLVGAHTSDLLPLKTITCWAAPPTCAPPCVPSSEGLAEGRQSVGPAQADGASEERGWLGAIAQESDFAGSAAVPSSMPLNVLKCLAVDGCQTLISAIEPLMMAVGGAMVGAPGLQLAASTSAPASASLVVAPTEQRRWVGGASRLLSQSEPQTQANGSLSQLVQMRGCVAGHGAEAVLCDALASLAALLCDDAGRNQLAATPSAAACLINLLNAPLDTSSNGLPAAQLRAWRSVAFHALTCLCLAASSPSLQAAMLGAGLPLFLLRLCVRRGDALDVVQLARLSARLLGMLAGMLPMIPSSQAASTASDHKDGASGHIAIEIGRLLRLLLPGGLTDCLISPSAFLRSLHSETRSARLIWGPSMADRLRNWLDNELHSLVSSGHAGGLEVWEWREIAPPEYPEIGDEFQVAGVFLSAYVSTGGAQASATDQHGSHNTRLPPAVDFLKALLESLREEKSSASKRRPGAPPTRSLRLMAAALAQLASDNPGCFAEMDGTSHDAALLRWLICTTDSELLHSSLCALNAFLEASSSNAASVLVAACLPALHLALRQAFDTCEVALRAVTIGLANATTTEGGAHIIATATATSATAADPKAPYVIAKADLMPDQLANKQPLGQEVLHSGVLLTLISLVCGAVAREGAGERGEKGSMTSLTEERRLQGTRCTALSAICMLLLDPDIGGEVEHLLESCLAPAIVDEIAQLAQMLDSSPASRLSTLATLVDADSTSAAHAAHALLELFDGEHSTPTLVWGSARRTALKRAVGSELEPIFHYLWDAARGGTGIGAVRAGDVVWDPSALVRRMVRTGTELVVGGLFIRPFVAAEGFHRFSSAEKAGDFLVNLLKAIHSESIFFGALTTQIGAGLCDHQDASPDAVLNRAQTVPSEVEQASHNLNELWEALQLLLSTNVGLQAHHACLAYVDFLFAVPRLLLPYAVQARVCQVIGLLLKAGEGSTSFAHAIGGRQMVWLLSVCRRAPPLAVLVLNVALDLVRRSPRAIFELFASGGLLLILQSIFACSLDPSQCVAGANAVGTEASPTPSSSCACSAHYVDRMAAPGAQAASILSPAECSGSNLPERLGAIRVLVAMASDSRHGAEIADMICSLLTPRFRMAFEARQPEHFLSLFDGQRARFQSNQHVPYIRIHQSSFLTLNDFAVTHFLFSQIQWGPLSEEICASGTLHGELSFASS